MRRGGFTLIELLVVVLIVTILMGLLIPGLMAVRQGMRKAETSQLIAAVSQALDVYAIGEQGLPPPDDGHFFDTEGKDGDDLVQLKDFPNWPTLDKLLHQGLTFDRKRHLRPEGTGQRLVDSWGGPIRYVIGSGSDDHGRTPQGSFDDWNWDRENDRPIESGYPYVYSYGRNNPKGADLDSWIYERRLR